nr:hypothetical protein [Tanacetum cinerariifolium]
MFLRRVLRESKAVYKTGGQNPLAGVFKIPGTLGHTKHTRKGKAGFHTTTQQIYSLLLTRISMGCLPRSACLGSLSLTQSPNSLVLGEEQADWKDDTDDESDDQELEVHYMYMAKLQQVSPDAVNSGPIFDKEPEQKVQNDDHYDVFAIECQHPEQSGSVHKTYLIEQDAHNMIIESEDMNYDNEQIDQYDEDMI